MTDNGNGRTALVIASNPRGVVLKATLKVTEFEHVAVEMEPAASEDLGLRRNILADLFEAAGQPLVDGVYVIQMGFDSETDEQTCTFVQLPETIDVDRFNNEVAPQLLGDETQLGELFVDWYKDLTAAHRGFAQLGNLEQLARAIVSSVLTTGINDSDPLCRDIELPTIEQIEGLELVGACAVCAFVDRGNIETMMAMMQGKEPPMMAGVNVVNGVKVRALIEDGRIIVPVGYLAHENPWEHTFHNELVARLAPIVPTVVRNTLEKLAVEFELKRRMEQRFGDALLASYNIETTTVSVLADQREAEVLEEYRRQREAQDRGIPPFLQFLAHGGDGLEGDGEFAP